VKASGVPAALRDEAKTRFLRRYNSLMSPKRFFLIAALMLASAVTSAQTGAVKVPEPKGLSACKNDDPVASAEKRIAPSAGAQFIACFASNEKVDVQGPSGTVSLPVEHAVALSVSGGPYTRPALDSLLSQVREQWKSFEPLSKDHENYVARLNALINGGGPDAQGDSIDSIKPVLVSIDRLDEQSYGVVSIREYEITVDGKQVRSIEADAGALVLQGTRLVRLEIIRQLRAPSDVDEVRTQIAAWAHAVKKEA